MTQILASMARDLPDPKRRWYRLEVTTLCMPAGSKRTFNDLAQSIATHTFPPGVSTARHLGRLQWAIPSWILRLLDPARAEGAWADLAPSPA